MWGLIHHGELSIGAPPIPLPEDLRRLWFHQDRPGWRLNQIELAPESWWILAFSTHRGDLLQKRLPFGITSAPVYFQKVMEQLSQDLKGVAIYLDDILVSRESAGTSTESQTTTTEARWKRTALSSGKRCVRTASGGMPWTSTLRKGIIKGDKVEAVKKMPTPQNVRTLRSFVWSRQLYNKFLPKLSTVMAPLHQLLKKNTPWKWTTQEDEALRKLRDALSRHRFGTFRPDIGHRNLMWCLRDSLGAVLFHHYQDGSERPLAYASKTLASTQKRYSWIHKKALSIIFAFKKFYQFLYGRQFILIMDHKSLISIFGPKKETPVMAANRLSRWALTLNQYQYTIEYRKTSAHVNVDA